MVQSHLTEPQGNLEKWNGGRGYGKERRLLNPRSTNRKETCVACLQSCNIAALQSINLEILQPIRIHQKP